MKKNYKCKTIERENNNCYINYLDNKKTRVEHIQQYGLDSVPVQEGRGVIVDTGASDSNKVMVGGGAFHSELKEGETIVYNQKRKSSIKLGDAGEIGLSSEGSFISLDNEKGNIKIEDDGKIEIKNEQENLKEVLHLLGEISSDIKNNASRTFNTLTAKVVALKLEPAKISAGAATSASLAVALNTTLGIITGTFEQLKDSWVDNVNTINSKITQVENKINGLLK